jgi:hypothetical protein
MVNAPGIRPRDSTQKLKENDKKFKKIKKNFEISIYYVL